MIFSVNVLSKNSSTSSNHLRVKHLETITCLTGGLSPGVSETSSAQEKDPADEEVKPA